MKTKHVLARCALPIIAKSYGMPDLNVKSPPNNTFVMILVNFVDYLFRYLPMRQPFPLIPLTYKYGRHYVMF